jgi:hypothetical protein
MSPCWTVKVFVHSAVFFKYYFIRRTDHPNIMAACCVLWFSQQNVSGLIAIARLAQNNVLLYISLFMASISICSSFFGSYPKENLKSIDPKHAKIASSVNYVQIWDILSFYWQVHLITPFSPGTNIHSYFSIT